MELTTTELGLSECLCFSLPSQSRQLDVNMGTLHSAFAGLPTSKLLPYLQDSRLPFRLFPVLTTPSPGENDNASHLKMANV